MIVIIARTGGGNCAAELWMGAAGGVGGRHTAADQRGRDAHAVAREHAAVVVRAVRRGAGAAEPAAGLLAPYGGCGQHHGSVRRPPSTPLTAGLRENRPARLSLAGHPWLPLCLQAYEARWQSLEDGLLQ
jgi:hypothetical protein